MKTSKHQMLTLRFEALKMDGDEMFNEFYARLNDTVNFSFNLGEKIADNKFLRKLSRSLPERFMSKVTAIEESKDIDSMKIDDLVWSLQTYELSFPQSKKKSLALRSSKGKGKKSD